MERALVSKILSVEEFFRLGAFRPANVQRDFRWGWPQAEKLLTDIEVAAREAGLLAGEDVPENDEDQTDPEDGADEPPLEIADVESAAERAPNVFFAGAMILFPANVDGGEYEIFDGFQRATTLTIAVAVLRDVLNETLGDDPIIARLHACIAAPARDDAFRLSHPGKAVALSRFVQPIGKAGVPRNAPSAPEHDSDKRVFDIQRKMARKFLRIRPEDARAFAAFLLDHVRLAAILVDNQRLARGAFVSTNLYGVRLRRDELFKGQLMSLARSIDEERRIEEIWNDVRTKIDDQLEEFLIAIDLLTRRRPQSPDCLGDLLIDLEARAQRGALIPWMGLLNRYADAWRALEEHLKFPHGGPLGNYIWRLSFFPWSEWKPAALCWMERFQAQKQSSSNQQRVYNKFRDRFEQLGRRCLAITIYDFGEGRRAEIFLNTVRRQLRASPELPYSMDRSGIRPLDFSRKVRADVKARLSLPIEDRQIRRAVILWHEATLWGEHAPGHLRRGTVEHVLPEKPTLTSRWRAAFPLEETRYVCHNSLGNMCVVSAEANMEMGNQDYAEKQAVLAAHNEYDKFKTAADLEVVRAWTQEVIQERTARIASAIWASIDLPEP